MFRPSDAFSGQPLLYSPVSTSDADERGRTLHPSTRRAGSPLLPSSSSAAEAADSAPAVLIPRARSAATPTPPRPIRPVFPRRWSFRSRSPAAASDAPAVARRRYTYAAVALGITLVAFTVQTELAAIVQHDLGWDKAYCMLYLTHGSWALLWPAQLAVLRLQQRDMPWPAFWRRHVWLLRTTAYMVERQDAKVLSSSHNSQSHAQEPVSLLRSPWPYILRTTACVTTALTVAGLSWYVAVSMTTPSDLTAIYHCSAFFAYAFSVPLLKERLRVDKCLAVAVAICGVLVVAYGDSNSSEGSTSSNGADGSSGAAIITNRINSNNEARARGGNSVFQLDDSNTRFIGNIVIGAGSVLYGLYEVLYKRFACPPDGTSAGRGMIFANAFGSLIGLFTLLVLWVPLPILHWLRWEMFSLPTGRTAWLLFVSMLANAAFASAFLVLVSLTSPVLGSVAALLTIFIVALADWLKTGEPPGAATLLGGLLIVAAFGMLSWSTWREMVEDARKRELQLDDDRGDTTDALGSDDGNDDTDA